MKWEEASDNLSDVTADTTGFKTWTTSVEQPRHGIQSTVNVNMQQKRFVSSLQTTEQEFYRELITKKKKNVIQEAINVNCPRINVFSR